MSVETKVEHEEDRNSIFKEGNFVANEHHIIHVTSKAKKGYSTDYNIFEGTVIKLKKPSASNYSSAGHHSDEWLCDRFKQFKGKITIEVE